MVDVNIRLWGDEWEQRLGKLTATVTAQGPITRAWGHPVSVPGDVTIDGERALFRALDVPPEHVRRGSRALSARVPAEP